VLCLHGGAPCVSRDPAVIEWLHRISGTLASGSSQPIRAVKDFWRELMRVVVHDPAASFFARRHLLGQMLEATARDMKGHSPRRAWIVVMSALLNDRTLWRQPL